MSDLKGIEYKRFEDIKHIREDGSEYWSARELGPALDYAKWENFAKVIKRAMIACENSGHSIPDDFPEVRKIVEAGVTTKPKKDYELSRYACYLIVQNGDPRKEVIALGQTYFAIQTYRQEVADHFNELDEDNRRLVVRGDIKQWNQMLAETAHNAGVITNEEFAIFQNAGYMGLYGGLDVDDIHTKKQLEVGQKILDYMGSTELIANLFRISQTEEKLRKDKIVGAETATSVHYNVGKEVRTAIEKIGGTMPEDLPTPEKSIQQIEKEQMQRLKKPSDSRQRNIILTFIRVIKSVRRSLRRLRRPMPYCLIRIRDASMISSVMQHLMAQAVEPVALISQAWIWGIFLVTFSEISSEVEEAVAEEMVLHRVQMSVSV